MNHGPDDMHPGPPPEEAQASLEERLEWYETQPDKIVMKRDFSNRGSEKLEPEEALQIRDAHLERLQELGVKVPAHEVVGIREEEGHVWVYEASDRVEGEVLDLALTEHDQRIKAEDLTRHYEGLIAYMKEVYENGGPYLSDVTRANEQFMVGHTAGGEDTVYLTDVGPLIEVFHKDTPGHPDNDFYFRGVHLLAWTLKFAKMFGQNVEPQLEDLQAFQTLIADKHPIRE